MKNISLYYTGGGSDKVYRAQIFEDGGLFRVNFQFGRRGAHLAEGTKTPIPVSLALAENIFAKLVKEKTGKGYTEDAGGNPFDGDMGKLAEVLPHPQKTLVTRGQASGWSAWDFLLQRKYDGELARRDVTGAALLGELVTARSGAFLTPADKALIARHGSFFAAFTVEAVHGENVLNRSTRERWGILCSFAAQFTPDIVLADVVTDIDAAFASGAEGVCAHAWDAPWGEMLAVKQGGIWTCRVTRMGGTQSVGIEDADTGQDRGNVRLGGGKCDRVKLGSIIRVEGMGLTDMGKIRQPVAAREWLVKF